MRARSGHIVFEDSVGYADLEPLFRDLFRLFLEETDQMKDDPEYFEILLEENLRSLRNGRKPDGFNREGTMRMVFPLGERKEFYLYGRGRNADVPRVAKVLSQLLAKHELKHEVEWDTLLRFAEE